MNLQHKASSSHAPDLDWSQVSETVLMLTLAVAQIELSLRSGDESVSSLADAFTNMAQNVAEIKNTAGQMEPSGQRESISSQCDSVTGQMQHAIVSFQFYDKLTQRLSHLSQTLGDLSKLVREPSKLYDPRSWQELQSTIKSTYSIEADAYMFDAILKGCSVEEALNSRKEQKANIQLQKPTDKDDIELF